jgi:hypothetical protein
VDDGLLKFQIRHTTVISGVAVKCCNGLAHRNIRGADLSCVVGIVVGLRTREGKGGAKLPPAPTLRRRYIWLPYFDSLSGGLNRYAEMGYDARPCSFLFPPMPKPL